MPGQNRKAGAVTPPPRRLVLWTGRALAALFAAAGLFLIGADVARSIGQDMLSLKPLGQVWYELDAGSLNLFQAVVERYLLPDLWDPVIVTLLNWPAFVLPLAVAMVLAVLTRPRRSM